MAKKQTMDHAQLLVLSLLAGEDIDLYHIIFLVYTCPVPL